MITLTTSFNLPSGSRLDIGRPLFNEEISELIIDLKLITSPAANATVTTVRVVITNVESDQLSRQTTPPVGLLIDDRSRYFISTRRATPTGYTDAINAWRAGATMAARKAALEAHLLSAGHFDASLAGT